jgi:hypothetical protein
MFGHQNAEVHIVDFILTQTGTYQEQGLRPFETHIEAHHIDELVRNTRGGQNLGVAAVESVAGEIIRPQATVEAPVNIAHGWRSRRFRFLMRVVERHPFAGTATQRVYFGYTDQCDASFNHLDPNMRIYFNSETIVNDFIRQTPNGPVVEAQVIGANQIVSPLDMSGDVPANGYYHKPTAFLIRPEDVFGVGQTQHMAQMMAATGQFPGGFDVTYDARNMVGQGGAYKYSRRRDTAPSRYLSDTLQAYNHAISEARMSEDENLVNDRDLIYGEAQSHAANQDIHKNLFFAKLKDGAGFMERGFVTLADLQRICPELNRPGVLNYSLDDGRSIRQVNFAEQSEQWMGSDRMTLAASTLAQVVPSIMMDNFIRSISFAVTNGRGLGDYAIHLHEHSTRSVVDNLPMIPYLTEFQRRLVTDALNTITHHNQIGFQISMASDLAGDSVIDISLDGEPVRRYVAPTFSDSLFAPIITHRRDLPNLISNDLMFLVENAVPAQRQAQPIMTQPHQAYHQQPSAYPGVSIPQQGPSYDNDSGLL